MSGRQDDDFEDDDGIEEELDRHYEALRRFVYDYIDENDVPDEIIAALLSDLALEMRKVAYVLDTEKPSVGGLKMMLDRYKTDLESAVRRHKQEAEEFIAGMQEAMTEAKDRLQEELESLDEDDDGEEDTDEEADDDLDDDDLDDDDDDSEDEDDDSEDDDESEEAGKGTDEPGREPSEPADAPKKDKPGKGKAK
ncbi:hypothetical protein PQJ75_16265 [Rhodoplanes sp. TEM]|uniref:ATPase n=1 Tax=Rhodoplanes tepidamans TaxID=200616 RepID=A0ABT5JC49_RHOTP|nr:MULTISPECIES: hypothetical protein [Rhodoplanes]MDC7787261.1 hypothetical protein [Rhodoplanes tepidamans]MDC7985289.1 hypothetical protein [Rhodoplanes sp. TEM]MDQ0357796.1 cobalamin biosynthesis protein CobT [Rhodoplanes tepidamans]